MSRTLIFGNRTKEPNIRMLSELSEVLFEPEILEQGDRELYYMYRDLAMSRHDHEIIKAHCLRYDITVIPPAVLGREYVKTMGHYHPVVAGTAMSYPEVYEILNGECHFLLQKKEDGKIIDVVIIKALQGDKVIIPPNYGHVTINPSNHELKMANWVSRDFISDYEHYFKLHGAAYYLLSEGLSANANYGTVPEVRDIRPRSFSEVGLVKGKEMYGLVSSIENLDFLNRPQDFGWLFEKVLLQK